MPALELDFEHTPPPPEPLTQTDLIPPRGRNRYPTAVGFGDYGNFSRYTYSGDLLALDDRSIGSEEISTSLFQIKSIDTISDRFSIRTSTPVEDSF